MLQASLSSKANSFGALTFIVRESWVGCRCKTMWSCFPKYGGRPSTWSVVGVPMCVLSTAMSGAMRAVPDARPDAWPDAGLDARPDAGPDARPDAGPAGASWFCLYGLDDAPASWAAPAGQAGHSRFIPEF